MKMTSAEKCRGPADPRPRERRSAEKAATLSADFDAQMSETESPVSPRSDPNTLRILTQRRRGLRRDVNASR